MINIFDYIKDCLRNPQFRRYWEEEMSDFGTTIFTEEIDDNDDVLDIIVYGKLNPRTKKDVDNIALKRGLIKKSGRVVTEIDLFEKNGNCPVDEFLDSFKDEQLRAKTLKNIVSLAIEGSNSRPPLSKYVGDGLFELRTKSGNNIDRIFYFFVFGNRIIMTNGYIKKSQKIDDLEFEKAKKYRDEYFKWH